MGDIYTLIDGLTRWVGKWSPPTDCCAVYFAINKVGTTDMWTEDCGGVWASFDVEPIFPVTFRPTMAC